MKNLLTALALTVTFSASSYAARHTGSTAQTGSNAAVQQASFRHCDIYPVGSPAWAICRGVMNAPDEPETRAGLTAAASIIDQCNQFPTGHPKHCANLAAASIIDQCNQFPSDHPKSCRNLVSMNIIQACNQFPTDHPMHCSRLLSYVPKCPPGQVTCKHMLVKDEKVGPIYAGDEKVGVVKVAEVEERILRASSVLSFDGEAVK